MIDNDTPAQLLAGENGHTARRRFLQIAGGATLAAGLAACGSGDGTSTATPTPTPTPSATNTVAIDSDYLNFALNLEYLQAQYFAYATTGFGIAALPASSTIPGGGPALLTGVGTQGTVTGGAKVTFSDSLNAEYAREMAVQNLAHVGFLRSMAGTAAVAMPALDISTSTAGGFNRIAGLAGVPSFNPYADDASFLLGAFILNDVVVTAYRGLLPLLTNSLYLSAVAGILATEAHHAALVRSQLFNAGATVQGYATLISDMRDSYDGTTDDDQGVLSGTTANITPADTNGIIYARTTGQVLNVFYTNHAAVVGGGFFPSGINNSFLASSAAN